MTAFAYSYGYAHAGHWATSITSDEVMLASNSLDSDISLAPEQYVTLCVAIGEFPRENLGQRIHIVRVEAPGEASFSLADALTNDSGHTAFWAPVPVQDATGAAENVLNWDLDLGTGSPARSGTIHATLHFGGQGKPLVYEDPDEE